IASAGNDRAIRLWDVKGRGIARLTGHENAVIRGAFTPDGKYVLSGSSRYQTADRVLRVWDAKSGKGLPEKGIETPGGVEAMAFAPDGKTALLSQPGVGLTLVRLDVPARVDEPTGKVTLKIDKVSATHNGGGEIVFVVVATIDNGTGQVLDIKSN